MRPVGRTSCKNKARRPGFQEFRVTRCIFLGLLHMVAFLLTSSEPVTPADREPNRGWALGTTFGMTCGHCFSGHRQSLAQPSREVPPLYCLDRGNIWSPETFPSCPRPSGSLRTWISALRSLSLYPIVLNADCREASELLYRLELTLRVSFWRFPLWLSYSEPTWYP